MRCGDDKPPPLSFLGFLSPISIPKNGMYAYPSYTQASERIARGFQDPSCDPSCDPPTLTDTRLPCSDKISTFGLGVLGAGGGRLYSKLKQGLRSRVTFNESVGC